MIRSVVRYLFGDGNGGLDAASLVLGGIAVALIGLTLFTIIFRPVTASLPPPAVVWTTENVQTPICEGGVLAYDAQIEFLETVVVSTSINPVIDLSTGETILFLAQPIVEGTVRLAGDRVPPGGPSARVRDVSTLPPGLYSSRFALLVPGRQPAIRVIDFEIVSCDGPGLAATPYP